MLTPYLQRVGAHVEVVVHEREGVVGLLLRPARALRAHRLRLLVRHVVELARAAGHYAL